MTSPLDFDAHALSALIHSRQLSCRELMQATLARIDALNPRFNAIVNLADGDALLQQADACDAELAQGPSRGWLHGIPLAIKDTGHALGFPSTIGSPLLKNMLPPADSVHVARMKAAGGIVIGKTNVPEFGLGSHTYNTVFGATGNAWDPGKTAGGSSGGACVALALRMLCIADGSDFMGSLRNPAGWNNVFGLRPTQGRVPNWPATDVWISQLGTAGPMARTVRDLARLLNIQAGADLHAPLSLDSGGQDFVPGPDASLQGLRIGWLGDLGGHLALEPGIREVCEAALGRMTEGGAIVEPTPLGFNAERLWQAWLVWRRALVAPNVAAVLPLLPDARSLVKPAALWEHDSAQGLTFAEMMAASQLRTRWLQRLLKLFTRFDLLALPVAQVWPFDVTLDWPKSIADRPMDTYHRWMECTLYATFAGAPAISVPAGFDASGRLPMGLQLIAAPRADAALLRAAAAYEALIPDLLARRPLAIA